MIGRGALQNPWIFSERDFGSISLSERIELMEYHLHLFEEQWRDIKSYQLLKKYFKVYLSSFDGAAEMRQQCMLTATYEEAKKLLEEYRVKFHLDK